MTVLLTNDDGFGAAGLETLIEILSPDHTVYVVAPDKDCSGVSHGFTMTQPLRIKKTGERMFKCSGLPADCTDVGTKRLMDKLPDAVISGINRGGNIGTDILYSGTAAAARQASLHGIPGIAASLESKTGDWNYGPLAAFVRDNLANLISLCAEDVFVNINARDLPSYKGWRMTVPAKRDYRDSAELWDAPDGHLYSFFKGGTAVAPLKADNDYTAVQEGFISVSRVFAQPCSAGGSFDIPDDFFKMP